VGRWTTDNPVVIRSDPFTEQFVLDLHDDQLALIERRRLAGDGTVRLDIEINAALTGGLPASRPSAVADDETPDEMTFGDGSWPQVHRTHTVFISASQWTDTLIGINAHAAMAIIVPLPLLDNAAREVGNVLRDALEMIATGKPAKAVIDARRVIEILDDVFGDLKKSKAEIKAIADITADQRTQDQRFALLRHALYSVASPPAHGDRDALAFTWQRDNAMTVLAAVAALAVLRSGTQP
jgi:hypothetical protein